MPRGWQGAEEVVGYLEEDGVDPKSVTETFAAVTLEVDTRRWAGVPFYLRTGKRLGKRVTEIAVVFKRAPHLPFEHTATEELGQNAIVIRVQPDEGVTIRFGSKVPGRADGGPRRHDGLRLRLVVHRGLARGVRTPHPRRAARRPAALPAARGGRVVLADPRPAHEALGQVGQAGAVPRRHVGTALGRPRCSNATDERGGCRDPRPDRHHDHRDQQDPGAPAQRGRRDGARARADARRRRRGHRRRQRHRGRQPGEPPAPLPHHRRHRRRPPRQEPPRRPDPPRRRRRCERDRRAPALRRPGQPRPERRRAAAAARLPHRRLVAR